ncbi:MAG: hypothetical protein JW880_04155 [Candidatus Thermoplasmatota archaeon]|nr:hypothetical protein [Candidatus Thermoplasmatota archaeon]
MEGQVAPLANVHLPADPYGPYEVRDGASLEEVLEVEETLRLEGSHESPAIPTLAFLLILDRRIIAP